MSIEQRRARLLELYNFQHEGVDPDDEQVIAGEISIHEDILRSFDNEMAGLSTFALGE